MSLFMTYLNTFASASTSSRKRHWNDTVQAGLNAGGLKQVTEGSSSTRYAGSPAISGLTSAASLHRWSAEFV